MSITSISSQRYSSAYTELKKHGEGTLDLTAAKIMEYLGYLDGTTQTTGAIRGFFWELGGRQTPEGRDWVDDSIARPEYRENLMKAIRHVCPQTILKDTLDELLKSPDDVDPLVMKQAIISAFGKEAAGEIFGIMYKKYTPKVYTKGLWEDFHIGKVIHRDLLRKTLEEQGTTSPLAGAGSSLKGTLALVKSEVGMRNETGTDCYIVAAWTLLRNVPRLRNQILKNLPSSYSQRINHKSHTISLSPLKTLAISHLQAAPGTPLTGSKEIRTLVDSISGIRSGHKMGDAGEVIIQIASTLPPSSLGSIFPKIRLEQTARAQGRFLRPSIEESPLVIEPGYSPSFEENFKMRFGRHVNPDHTSDVAADCVRFDGPPPPDLFISVNRKTSLIPLILHDHYELPAAFATGSGPSQYTLEAFTHWTGGHYLSFYKNQEGQWVMVNDSTASSPSASQLTYYRNRASTIYYKRDDVSSLDSEEDNRWWREALPVREEPAPSTAGCSIS